MGQQIFGHSTAHQPKAHKADPFFAHQIAPSLFFYHLASEEY
jgi:hypothetical protein